MKYYNKETDYLYFMALVAVVKEWCRLQKSLNATLFYCLHFIRFKHADLSSNL